MVSMVIIWHGYLCVLITHTHAHTYTHTHKTISLHKTTPRPRHTTRRQSQRTHTPTQPLHIILPCRHTQQNCHPRAAMCVLCSSSHCASSLYLFLFRSLPSLLLPLSLSLSLSLLILLTDLPLQICRHGSYCSSTPTTQSFAPSKENPTGTSQLLCPGVC